jgi:CHAT domain-containing protein/Tfp pilus assembly protein PilF
VLSAEELHARGVAAINGGRVRAARRPLELALERATDDATLGAVEASLAFVEAETGNREVAMRLCETALARSGLSDETRGSLLSQHGVLVFFSGRTAEATRELDAAIEKLTDYPTLLGRAHGNRGTAHLQQNQLDLARADFERAVALLHQAGLPLEAAMGEHNLGYTRLLAGDLAAALEEMGRARPILAPLSSVNAAVCDQDRAEVLMASGLVAEGRAALHDAAHAYGRARLARRQAVAELTLAKSLLVTDPVAARPIARRAMRRFARDQAPAWQARAEAVAVQADVMSGRGAPAVLGRGDELVDELQGEGLPWEAAALRLALARGHVHHGAHDRARELLSRSDVSPKAPLAVRLLARDVRAELASGRSTTSALAHLRSGLDDLHAWQSSFGSLDLQTNVVGHGVRLAVRGLALASQSRSDAVLFEWSERARMLASRIQPVRAPQDPQTAADLAELRAEPTPEREAELRRRIRERAWQHRGSGAVADPVALPELQERLGEDTALVAYVVTAERVVALVVTSGGTARHELGERSRLDAALSGMLPDLDMAASELPDALAGSVRRTLAGRLDAVAALLVAPLLADLGARRLVLTPSGVLAGVPWTLLPGLVGRPVTVGQSATSWLARAATPLRTGTAGFVAGPRVVRAESEVRAAATAWRSAPVLAGEDATAAAVSGLAGRVDVLHVAAHGRHSAENPLFSGLELVDGTWFGYDIDQLPAVPDVVLLSACEVGRSSVRWGEELIGMTAAWLHAGARCVVASPAAVNDDAAHDALVRVHEALVSGADPATALAATVAAVSVDAAPAPFLCFG